MSFGVEEAGDCYRLLKIKEDLVSGRGFQAPFDLNGHGEEPKLWGLQQACEWFEFTIVLAVA